MLDVKFGKGDAKSFEHFAESAFGAKGHALQTHFDFGIVGKEILELIKVVHEMIPGVIHLFLIAGERGFGRCGADGGLEYQ